MSETKDVLILAIESSCDETAAAVVKRMEEKYCPMSFLHRLPCIHCMEVLCRRLHPENI